MTYRALSSRPRAALWGVVAAADLAVLGFSAVVLLVAAGVLAATIIATGHARRVRSTPAGPRLTRVR
jgi:hypothetical protein